MLPFQIRKQKHSEYPEFKSIVACIDFTKQDNSVGIKGDISQFQEYEPKQEVAAHMSGSLCFAGNHNFLYIKKAPPDYSGGAI